MTTDKAVETIKAICSQLTSNIDKTEIEQSCEVILDKITELEMKVHDLEDNNETLERNNDRLRETVDKKEKAIDNANEKIDELISDLTLMKEKHLLPADTLEDENKNKILAGIHKNLSLEQIEELEKKAKEMMPKGIIYQEVI